MREYEQLKEMKRTVARFYNDVHSNNVSDFIVWLDCQMELIKEENDKIRRIKNGNTT